MFLPLFFFILKATIESYYIYFIPFLSNSIPSPTCPFFPITTSIFFVLKISMNVISLMPIKLHPPKTGSASTVYLVPLQGWCAKGNSQGRRQEIQWLSKRCSAERDCHHMHIQLTLNQTNLAPCQFWHKQCHYHYFWKEDAKSRSTSVTKVTFWVEK